MMMKMMMTDYDDDYDYAIDDVIVVMMISGLLR